MERGSGILMHISSLPSPHGIGTLGGDARAFADFLKASGQKYWQILPMGPTGFGDSPYQSPSMYAGNPYFIDFDWLVQKGLVKKRAIEAVDWGSDPRFVDYGVIYRERGFILRQAESCVPPSMREDIEEFRHKSSAWIEDYALFMAIKRRFKMRSWIEWPSEGLRMYDKGVISHYTELLREEIDFIVFTQYVFWLQWAKLRKYVNSLGIRIIGDLPIYASLDSGDVWANPQFYALDENRIPVCVSGVPPDYFSQDGQLWGNPLYDWQALKAGGYKYWIDRVKAAEETVDIVRIDHFRGFESFWSVKYGEETAKNGTWCKGPGMGLINAIKKNAAGLGIIAENLGILTPEVDRLLSNSGFPGMKVLQFAFDSGGGSDYLPHNHERGCVCYTGTHDNTTALEWARELGKADSGFLTLYTGACGSAEKMADAIIRAGMSSVADVFIAQMQDWLRLPGDCRMNTPGKPQGNWRWRLLPGELTEELAGRIFSMTRAFGR